MIQIIYIYHLLYFNLSTIQAGFSFKTKVRLREIKYLITCLSHTPSKFELQFMLTSGLSDVMAAAPKLLLSSIISPPYS